MNLLFLTYNTGRVEPTGFLHNSYVLDQLAENLLIAHGDWSTLNLAPKWGNTLRRKFAQECLLDALDAFEELYSADFSFMRELCVQRFERKIILERCDRLRLLAGNIRAHPGNFIQKAILLLPAYTNPDIHFPGKISYLSRQAVFGSDKFWPLLHKVQYERLLNYIGELKMDLSCLAIYRR